MDGIHDLRDLISMITLLGLANDMSMRPPEAWPVNIGFDWRKLNAQSGKLRLKDAVILVDGEEQKKTKLLKNIISKSSVCSWLPLLMVLLMKYFITHNDQAQPGRATDVMLSDADIFTVWSRHLLGDFKENYGC